MEEERRPDSDYVLTVEFKPKVGELVKTKMPVDMETGKAAHDDKLETLDVKYLPEDTTVVYRSDVGPPGNSGYIFAGILFIAGLVMIVLRLRKR